MKKKLMIGFILVLSLVFTACAKNEEVKSTQAAETTSVKEVTSSEKKAETTTEEVTKEQSVDTEKREITGVNGETIILPPVKDIKRVVVMNPISLSSLLNVIPDGVEIVGVNPVALNTSDPQILNKLLPDWENIKTDFFNKDGYGANIEELLTLNPDLILYDAKWQGEGMDKLNIPLIDVNVNENGEDAEKIMIAYEKVFKEIFDVNSENVIAKSWEELNADLANLLGDDKADKTALFIWSNTGDAVSIYGSDTYVKTYCEKLGLTNVADIEGYPAISMEQIYEWDPDYIFMLKGFDGVDHVANILNNTDEKDWSKLKAYKNKNLYNIPKTLLGWVSPSTDSPLMVYWLISKCYPEKLSNEDFSTLIDEHYKFVHKLELESEIINGILAE